MTTYVMGRAAHCYEFSRSSFFHSQLSYRCLQAQQAAVLSKKVLINTVCDSHMNILEHLAAIEPDISFRN